MDGSVVVVGGLIERVCHCDFAAIQTFVETQDAQYREDLQRGCMVAARAVQRAYWRDTAAMMKCKLPPDPQLYVKADARRLKVLIEAGVEGNEDAAFGVLVGLGLDQLHAYSYIVSIIPIIVAQQAK